MFDFHFSLFHTHADTHTHAERNEMERVKEREGEARQKMSWPFLSLLNIKEDLLLTLSVHLIAGGEERNMVRNEKSRRKISKKFGEDIYIRAQSQSTLSSITFYLLVIYLPKDIFITQTPVFHLHCFSLHFLSHFLTVSYYFFIYFFYFYYFI